MVKTISLKNINIMSNLKEKIYKYKKEEYYKSILRAIAESEEDIKNGRIVPGEEALEELRKKYGY